MGFPLKTYKYDVPTQGPASFGAVRKHDVHTGVDLYCEKEDPVFAMEAGTVVAVEDFTGQDAESPWWNETQAVLVEGKSGVILYGEIETDLEKGQHVAQGQRLGSVQTVLRRDKSKNPPNMLHVELYDHGTTESVWWPLDQPKPENLQDITPLLQCPESSS